jgi:hypothetical protein
MSIPKPAPIKRLTPPWIRGDFTGICEPHWTGAPDRLHELLTGVVAEALTHGMTAHGIGVALRGVLSELDAGRVGTAQIAELQPLLQLWERDRLRAEQGSPGSPGSPAEAEAVEELEPDEPEARPSRRSASPSGQETIALVAKAV